MTEDSEGFADMLVGNMTASAASSGHRPGRPWQIQWLANRGYCLSADGNRAGNGVKIQVWDCSADFEASGQVWSFDGRQHGLIRAYWDREYCLVVDGNNYMNGAKIQLWRCDPNNPDQYWTTSDGMIQPANQVSNFVSYCLVVDGNQGFNGAKIQLWECTGPLNQKKWRTFSPY